ncbi:MAG: putative caspase-like protein [bacterium]|jgi:uncharacterized caspase-like protein
MYSIQKSKFFKSIVVFLISIISTACTPSLHQFAQKGELKQLKQNVQSGSDINATNFSGETPLHVASKYGQLKVVKYLIKNGADLHAQNSFQETALYVASASGTLKVVQYLHQKGSSIHAQNHFGSTPLMAASKNGKSKVVYYLLEHGSKIYHQNHYEETAKSLATKNNHRKVLAMLISPPNKKQLVVASVQINKAPTIHIITPSLSRGLKLVRKQNIVEIIGKATDEQGISRIQINGKNVSVDELGNFRSTVSLTAGYNQVLVVAVDKLGKQATKSFGVIHRASGEIKTTKIKQGNYYALIIGNNKYQYLSKLETAKGDAVEVSKVLQDKYGFQTTLLLDAGKVKISRALNKLRKKIQKEDHLLIYYAGHGYFDKKVNKAYWLPIDAEKDDDTNWIISDTITTNIQRIASNHVLIISDSCYSGTLTRAASADLSASQGHQEFLNKMMKRPSRTLMASGGNEPVMDGGGGKHSVFAAALLNGLSKEKRNIFSAEELFYKYIKERVAGKSSQVPVYQVIRNSGHDGGDFVFQKK